MAETRGPEVPGGEPELGEPGQAVWSQGELSLTNDSWGDPGTFQEPSLSLGSPANGSFHGHEHVGLRGWRTGVILDTWARVHLSSVACLPSHL